MAWKPKCRLLPEAVLLLSLSGYLGCHQQRNVVATLDAGSSREIRIWADVYIENCQRFYYEVRVHSQPTVPISFIDCQSEEPTFNLLHSHDRNLIGVVESRRPEVLVAINDFASGETWPRASDKDSWEEKRIRGRRLRDRLKADHPHLTLALSDEIP
jgi:hypothetical protein